MVSDTHTTARHLSVVPVDPEEDQPARTDEPRREPVRVGPNSSSWDTDPNAEVEGRVVTAKQGAALAFWIRSARPDWSTRGIMAALEPYRHINHLELGIAALAAAQDPHTKTPARMVHDGHWWKRARPSQAIVPPDGMDYTPPCQIHPDAGHNEIECPDRIARLSQAKSGEKTKGQTFKENRWNAHVKRCQALGIDPGPRTY